MRSLQEEITCKVPMSSLVIGSKCMWSATALTVEDADRFWLEIADMDIGRTTWRCWY